MTRLNVYFCSAAIGAIVIASPALSQSTNSLVGANNSPSDEIPEIIVTAEKRSESLSDVGATVNVIGAQQLNSQGISSPQDLTKVISGLTIAQNGDGTPIYTLRGISLATVNFGASPTVSVYIDQQPVPFSVMTQGALLDLEQVEVLKGPQGTLFGQNATGGAINYVAAKPTDFFTSGIQVDYGRFDTARVEGYVSGPITDELKARLSVSGTDSGPWQQSDSRDASIGDQRKEAARLLLDWEPSDALHITANLNGWGDQSDTQSPQFVEPRTLVPEEAVPAIFTQPALTNARQTDFEPGVPFRRDNKFYQAATQINYSVTPDLTLSSLTSYSHVSIDSLSNASGTAYEIENGLTTGYVHAFNEELRASGDVPAEHIHYIAGATYQDDASFESDYLFIPLNSATHDVDGLGPINSSDARGYQGNKTYGIFGNVDWEIIPRLTLSGGLRYTGVKHTNQGCTYDGGDGTQAGIFTILSDAIRGAAGLPLGSPILPGGCTTLGPNFLPDDANQEFAEHNLSWRANVDYKITSNALLYTTISRGFKAGNYPIAPAFTTASLQPVKQEELTSYEVGTKLKFFDRRLSLNLSGYYYDYKNKQLFTNTITPLFGLLFQVQNIPKSNVKGADFDASWLLAPGLTVRTAVSYNHSQVGSYNGYDVFGNFISLTGKPFNLDPAWSNTNDIEYRRPIGRGLEAFGGVSSVYNSETHADLAGSAALEIRAYTTVDLRAGLASPAKGWQIMLYGRNVTNTYYWNYAMPGGDSVLRYAAMPVTYGVNLSAKF